MNQAAQLSRGSIEQFERARRDMRGRKDFRDSSTAVFRCFSPAILAFLNDRYPSTEHRVELGRPMGVPGLIKVSERQVGRAPGRNPAMLLIEPRSTLERDSLLSEAAESIDKFTRARRPAPRLIAFVSRKEFVLYRDGELTDLSVDNLNDSLRTIAEAIEELNPWLS